MKYRKLVLNTTNLDLIKDHLSNMAVAGIIKVEKAQGSMKPTSKNVRFSPFVYYKRNRPVYIENRVSPHSPPHIAIECEGFDSFPREVFYIGDTFYLSNDVVLVSSGEPHSLTKEIEITRITLLSKSNEPDAMKAYRTGIHRMINAIIAWNKWERPPASDEEVDQHIAFLDSGSAPVNPAYLYQDPEDSYDFWEPSC